MERQFLRHWGEEIFAGASSGLLLAFSFPPFASRFLVAIALVPFLRYQFFVLPPRASALSEEELARGRQRSAMRISLKRAFLSGFILGVAFFATLLYWILNLIPESGVVSRWILIPAMALLVSYLACYTALFGLALGYLANRLGRSAIWTAPAIWSLLEYARSHGELGFSWGALANALAVHPVAIQGIAFYGSFGLSLVIVAVNVLIALVIFAFRGRARLAGAISLLILVAGNLLWGKIEISRYDKKPKAEALFRKVALVQPNVSLAIKWDPAYRDSIFDQMKRYVKEASLGGARLVIFPETAAPVSFKASPEYLAVLEELARSNNIDILTGYVDHTRSEKDWNSHNAAALISSAGYIEGNYHKVNLLPFGEKIPFSQYIPALSSINFGQANFVAGKEQTIFDSEVGRFGVLICYESTFADFTRRYALRGADFLVNITNDGWFGPGPGPVQHAEMAILRAVENRMTLARAAYTGISFFVDPVGRIHEKIWLFTEGIIFDSVKKAEKPSFYSRHGDSVFFLMALGFLVLAGVLSRRD